MNRIREREGKIKSFTRARVRRNVQHFERANANALFVIVGNSIYISFLRRQLYNMFLNYEKIESQRVKVEFCLKIIDL